MRAERGFTLIELLVAVAIIGILAAIAIPQFSAYKVRSFNSRAESDIRNGITAEEAYYVTNETYASCSFNTTPCDTTLPGFKESSGVLTFFLETSGMTTTPVAGGSFAGAACHAKGDQMYTFSTDPMGGITISIGSVGAHAVPDCTASISALP